MSDGVISLIEALVVEGDMEVTLHGFRELAADGILLDDVVAVYARQLSLRSIQTPDGSVRACPAA